MCEIRRHDHRNTRVAEQERALTLNLVSTGGYPVGTPWAGTSEFWLVEMDRFFFFQAEDGIRDLTVTGVQTCALPIFAKGAAKAHEAGPDNVCWDFTYTPLDLTEAAFKEADVVVKERVLQNRLAPVPMEIGRASCRERV